MKKKSDEQLTAQLCDSIQTIFLGGSLVSPEFKHKEDFPNEATWFLSCLSQLKLVLSLYHEEQLKLPLSSYSQLEKVCGHWIEHYCLITLRDYLPTLSPPSAHKPDLSYGQLKVNLKENKDFIGLKMLIATINTVGTLHAENEEEDPLSIIPCMKKLELLSTSVELLCEWVTSWASTMFLRRQELRESLEATLEFLGASLVRKVDATYFIGRCMELVIGCFLSWSSQRADRPSVGELCQVILDLVGVLASLKIDTNSQPMRSCSSAAAHLRWLLAEPIDSDQAIAKFSQMGVFFKNQNQVFEVILRLAPPARQKLLTKFLGQEQKTPVDQTKFVNWKLRILPNNTAQECYVKHVAEKKETKTKATNFTWIGESSLATFDTLEICLGKDGKRFANLTSDNIRAHWIRSLLHSSGETHRFQIALTQDAVLLLEFGPSTDKRPKSHPEWNFNQEPCASELKDVRFPLRNISDRWLLVTEAYFRAEVPRQQREEVNGTMAVLSALKDLYWMPGRDWQSLRDKVWVGLVKDTRDCGTPSVSSGFARSYFAANPDKKTVGLVNCGTGGVKVVMYQNQAGKTISCMESRPEAALFSSLRVASYDPFSYGITPLLPKDGKDSSVLVRELLQQALARAPWCKEDVVRGQGEMKIEIFAFITGKIRQHWENSTAATQKTLDMAMREIFDSNTQPATKILNPKKSEDCSFFITEHLEGQMDLIATRELYNAVKMELGELKDDVVIASFGIGSSTSLWCVADVKPDAWRTSSITAVRFGMKDPNLVQVLGPKIVESLPSGHAFFDIVKKCPSPLIALKSGAIRGMWSPYLPGLRAALCDNKLLVNPPDLSRLDTEFHDISEAQICAHLSRALAMPVIGLLVHDSKFQYAIGKPPLWHQDLFHVTETGNPSANGKFLARAASNLNVAFQLALLQKPSSEDVFHPGLTYLTKCIVVMRKQPDGCAANDVLAILASQLARYAVWLREQVANDFTAYCLVANTIEESRNYFTAIKAEVVRGHFWNGKPSLPVENPAEAAEQLMEGEFDQTLRKMLSKIAEELLRLEPDQVDSVKSLFDSLTEHNKSEILRSLLSKQDDRNPDDQKHVTTLSDKLFGLGAELEHKIVQQSSSDTEKLIHYSTKLKEMGFQVSTPRQPARFPYTMNRKLVRNFAVILAFFAFPAAFAIKRK